VCISIYIAWNQAKAISYDELTIIQSKRLTLHGMHVSWNMLDFIIISIIIIIPNTDVT